MLSRHRVKLQGQSWSTKSHAHCLPHDAAVASHQCQCSSLWSSPACDPGQKCNCFRKGETHPRHFSAGFAGEPHKELRWHSWGSSWPQPWGDVNQLKVGKRRGKGKSLLREGKNNCTLQCLDVIVALCSNHINKIIWTKKCTFVL